jgi:rare lipoprotein A
MMVSAFVALLTACSPSNPRNAADESFHLSPRVIKIGDPVPKGGGIYKLGKPYLAGGKWYTPTQDPNYNEVGFASWYGDFFHGRETANHEVYDMNALTAAHPTLPLPSLARVTNLKNHRSIIVRINDRGPYKDGRIIDLSRRAAELLGFYNHGLAAVRVQYYGPAPLNGDDALEQSVVARKPWAVSMEHNAPAARGNAAAALLAATEAEESRTSTASAEPAKTTATFASADQWTAGFQPSRTSESGASTISAGFDSGISFDFFGRTR